MPRYIVSKYDHPEAFGLDYADGLDFLPEYDASRVTLSDLDEVIEMGVMTEEEAQMVAHRPHVKAVEEDVQDQAMAFEGHQNAPDSAGYEAAMRSLDDGYDPHARVFHQLDKAYVAGYEGQGVRVAVGDTGIRQETMRHVFGGRIVAQRSFIEGEAIEDGNGHGDFCCVAACPPQSSLIVGKVLSNAGSGPRSGIIAFIAWAVEQGANVISLSLGGRGFSQAYEDVIKAARDRGVITFCASGNGGRENEPVNAPANSPSAIACGASDHRTRKVADFSCRGPELANGFSGAGVKVQYDPPGNIPARPYSGTSMGTPAVACCYATVLSATPGTDPADQRLALEKMIEGCLDTEEPATAEGNGLPQAMDTIAKLTSPDPPKPEPEPEPKPDRPDGPQRRLYERLGYLDLRPVFRGGTNSPHAVWGEIRVDGSILVRAWDDPGEWDLDS